MKKIILAVLIGLFFVSNAEAKIGVNHYAYGWNQAQQEKWGKIKNGTSAIEKSAWGRIPDMYKYILTGEAAYVPTDLMKIMTGGYCGDNYKPTGCTFLTGHDAIRGNLQSLVLRYAAYGDLLTAEQKAQVTDVLVTIFNENMIKHPVETWDTDNTHYSWIYQTIFAEEIKDDNPTLYTTLTTNAKYLAWQARITQIAQSFIGGDGDDTAAYPIQGTNYDPNTLKEILAANANLEGFTGKVYFPDLKRKIPKIAEGMKGYFVPKFEQTFQWSDNQRLYYNYAYGNWDVVSVFATLNNNDPQLWYIWDKMYEVEKAANRTQPFSQYSNFSPWFDPYAPRATDTSGFNNFFNDTARGITIWHTGWGAEESAFYVNNWSTTWGDHNPNCSDFGLHRKGEWLIDWARGYYSVNFCSAYNSLIPFGAFQINGEKVQKELKRGLNWVYTKGSKNNRGILQPDGTYKPYITYSIEWASGPDNVREQTREIVDIRMKGGLDVIAVYDTLETPSGNDGTSTKKDFLGRTWDNVPNNIVNFGMFKTDQPARMQSSRYRHQFNWYIPLTDVVIGDNTWTWYGNATGSTDTGGYIKGKQKVTLRTFVKNYSSLLFNNRTFTKDAIGYPVVDKDVRSQGMSGQTLRIVPENEQFGRFNWLHTIYGRSETDPELIFTETPDGVMIENPGVELVTVKFKGGFDIQFTDLTVVEPPPPPPPICEPCPNCPPPPVCPAPTVCPDPIVCPPPVVCPAPVVCPVVDLKAEKIGKLFLQIEEAINESSN